MVRSTDKQNESKNEIRTKNDNGQKGISKSYWYQLSAESVESRNRNSQSKILIVRARRHAPAMMIDALPPPTFFDADLLRPSSVAFNMMNHSEYVHPQSPIQALQDL
jgi:hypothetical protein